MDMSDFTSAENKKMTTENDIPTFNPPIGDAPKVGVDGKSKKAQTFTPPYDIQHGSGMLLPPGREGGRPLRTVRQEFVPLLLRFLWCDWW